MSMKVSMLEGQCFGEAKCLSIVAIELACRHH